MDYVLIIDSCTDLPREYVVKSGIPVMSFTCLFKGKEYLDDFGKTLKYEEFYNEVRKGEMPTTAQVNSFRYAEEFKKYVNEGKAVVYIGFSSALSGSLNSARIARDEIVEENCNADITVIDSKCASMGEGLLAYYAIEMYEDGASKDELVNWVEENKLKINHWFTVDDLNHLKRGGRVSSFSAAIGTILSIKPVLHVDNEGRLIPITKVKGRKQSLRMLADKFKERAIKPEEQVVFISHGDCEEDARYVEKLIREEFSVKDVVINPIGPVIGTHSGPGTVALFFLGENR